MDIEFYTLEALRTPVGLVAAVWMLTQLLKGLLDKLGDHRTRYVALTIAWGLLLAVSAIDGALSWASLLLIVLNGAVVATAASGAHDLVAGARKAEAQNLTVNTTVAGDPKEIADQLTKQIARSKQRL